MCARLHRTCQDEREREYEYKFVFVSNLCVCATRLCQRFVHLCVPALCLWNEYVPSQVNMPMKMLLCMHGCLRVLEVTTTHGAPFNAEYGAFSDSIY